MLLISFTFSSIHFFVIYFLRCFLYLRTARGEQYWSFISEKEGIVISRFFNNAFLDRYMYIPRWSEDVISLNVVIPLCFSFVSKLNEQSMKSIWVDPSWWVLLFPMPLCMWSNGLFNWHYLHNFAIPPFSCVRCSFTSIHTMISCLRAKSCF